ncbi:hypothetical protein ACN20G_00325 [Streptomyces sp. BI20]|uniref:hypothetical protein n=1 Tax=Streptomyces sp. BI20 TaxID=3403460 RepID=UPI003C75CD32
MIDSAEKFLPADGSHRSRTYADWAAAHAPETAGAARELVDAMGAELARTWTKPGRFVDAMAVRARSLPAAHLPWFWDTVGHRLIGYGSKPGGRAYVLARAAEAEHGLPVDVGYRRANALLFAAGGAMPAKEFGAHQRFLTERLAPADAFRAWAELLVAWGSSAADLPADLVRRARSTARSAGVGEAEVAGLVGSVLAVTRGKAVPDPVLDGAAELLAAHRPSEEVAAGLLGIFPEGATDGGAWLRLLERSGAVDAWTAGRIGAERTVSDWVGHYAHMYCYAVRRGGGVGRQRMPEEILSLVGRLATALRAAGAPVSLHTTRHHWQGLDAELLDAVLAAGAPVVDPGPEVGLKVWEGPAQRPLVALAADPVFGPRLEGRVHANLLPPMWSWDGRRLPGSAVTLLPGNDAIAQEVAARAGKLVDRVAGGALASAEEALTELETLLDRPTATALEGIGTALGDCPTEAPLHLSLRSGLAEEWGWPALDGVLARFADRAAQADAEAGDPAPGVVGVTSSWPVLTVYGRDRAVAVGPHGVVAETAFALPPDTSLHTAHHIGGSFLIAWSTTAGARYGDTACWAERPEEVFRPERLDGLQPFTGGYQEPLGYRFATPDGSGAHDGGRLLRAGGREGVALQYLQVSDGERVWHNGHHVWRPWLAVDARTGEELGEVPLPEFADGTVSEAPEPTPAGVESTRHAESTTLAPLPAGLAASPLGDRDGLVGFRARAARRRTPGPLDVWAVESVDGRRAGFTIDREGQEPFGLLRPAGAPEEEADGSLVLVRGGGLSGVRAYAAGGGLLWRLPGFPSTLRLDTTTRARGVCAASLGVAVPPAFWHLLRVRDAAGSRALRELGAEAVRGLLDAAGDGPSALRTAIGRELPELSSRPVIAAVEWSVRRALAVAERRAELAERVRLIREELPPAPARTAPDEDLARALFGLGNPGEEQRRRDGAAASAHPATIEAVAADGLALAGRIPEAVRRLAPQAPPRDWSAVLGTIDAVAWRLVAGPGGDQERATLAAFLTAWADTPFARAGSTWWVGRAEPRAVASLRAAGLPVAAGAGPDATWWVAPAGASDGAVAAVDPRARTVLVDRDDALRLRRMVELVDERGAPAVPEAAAARFAELTGVRRPIARLVLAGFPRDPGHDEDVALARRAPFRASPWTGDLYRRLCERLGAAGRREVLAAGPPADPDALWERDGFGAAVERMAAVWVERLGARPPVDDALADELEEEIGVSEHWARALGSGPGAEGKVFRPAADWRLFADRYRGAQARPVLPDGTTGPRGTVLGLPIPAVAAALVWAWTERPAGDPATRWAGALHDLLRAELARPELLYPLAERADGDERELERRFGPARLPVVPAAPPTDGTEPAPTPIAWDAGALVVCAPSGAAFVRPALTADPVAWERLVTESGLARGLELFELLRVGGGLDRMRARAASGVVPEGCHELDPRVSCPELTDEAAEALGVSRDAAGYFLQLLTLARPTDRSVRRWNGWTGARLTAAREELAGVGAVVIAKRARAGRSAFAPGGWTELKAPHLPVETPKLGLYRVRPLWQNRIEGPFERLLAPAPAHELFAAAWRGRGEAQGQAQE